VQARDDGIDVRAVTAWAAFGTVDWSSLLTRESGHYEPGLWDIRSDTPRLTALGRLACALARGEPTAPSRWPVLASPGWWQRDLRLSVAPYGKVTALPARGAPLLIVGAGPLARAFGRLCHMRGLPYEMLADGKPDVAAAVRRHAAWAVVAAAGSGAARWQQSAGGLPAGARLLVVSCDEDEPAVDDTALTIRTSAPFGPWNHDHALARGLALLRQGTPWPAPGDEIVTPTYLPDLVQASLDLLIDGETGVWQLDNGESLSWAAFAMRAAEHAGLDASLVRAVSSPHLDGTTPRALPDAPARRGGGMLPSLDDALARYPRDHEPDPAPVPALRAVPEPAMDRSTPLPAH
jgi:dTDP-4-dehydrorhamnose reductase